MYDKSTDYYHMWKADKENIIRTMYRNMTDDLNAGYDPMGDTINRELSDIAEYKAAYKVLCDTIIEMALDHDWQFINKWCYKDMIRRGVIA